jgi:hypothetical protein
MPAASGQITTPEFSGAKPTSKIKAGTSAFDPAADIRFGRAITGARQHSCTARLDGLFVGDEFKVSSSRVETCSCQIGDNGEGSVGHLKKVGGLLLCLLIASAALSMAVNAWYQLAATGDLPIHARHGSGAVEPFTFGYFVGAIFYALVAVIGVGAIIILIDQHIGIPIVEKYRPRLRRFLGLLAAVSFVLPIVISIVRMSAAN